MLFRSDKPGRPARHLGLERHLHGIILLGAIILVDMRVDKINDTRQSVPELIAVEIGKGGRIVPIIFVSLVDPVFHLRCVSTRNRYSISLCFFSLPVKKITYIPNFVDNDRFHPYSAVKRTALRKKYGIAADKFVVLGSGQVQERKGVPDFIRLARQNPDVEFFWAGGFSFGRLTDGYSELKKVVDNPPANLHFTGIVSRDKIAELNNLADLFLLPSYNELFPMSVLEAFSCGTPVMLRDLDLYHSIIEGDYEPAKDVNEMQMKLTLLRNDPARLAHWQTQAQRAAKEYSKEHLADVWTKFYQEQARKGDA